MTEQASFEPTTLGDWREIAVALDGGSGKATEFIDEKIAQQGEDEKVVAHETQVLYLLMKLAKEMNDG